MWAAPHLAYSGRHTTHTVKTISAAERTPRDPYVDLFRFAILSLQGTRARAKEALA
jgi:hypothetical protein